MTHYDGQLNPIYLNSNEFDDSAKTENDFKKSERKMSMKRILSMLLVLCMCVSMLPSLSTSVNAADSVSMIVSYAQARVGKTGAELGYNVPWCAYFVCDCAAYANQTKAVPRNGSAHYLYFNVRDAGGEVVASPQPGDLVFYNCSSCDTNNDGIAMMHVGLVAYDGYSIEGNLSNSVKKKALNASFSDEYGHSTTTGVVQRVYVRPAYTSGTAIPQKPTIITNQPSYVSGENITISWTAVSGNSFYWINVFKDGKIIVDQTTGTSTSYTLTNAAVGEYLFYVSANNSAGTSGSSSYSFSVVQKEQRTIDNRYVSYFPIAAFPLSTGHINVYDASGNLYSNRYIDGATDVCILLEIYTDGWCKVRYPSTAEESGYFNAYVPLTVFTTATSPSSWTSPSNYTTYTRSDLSSVFHNVSSGSSCLLLKTEGSARQIIHPVSGQSYSMMGWISDPKQIHVSVNAVNLTLGGTESQVIYAWSTGIYSGNTSLFFECNNSNVDCAWGEWTNGKAPLTISANSRGTTTLTIGVKDRDNGTILDKTTVTATVDAKSYTISYNANGGTGAPSSQTKFHNTILTLSSTKPTRKGYTFVGWSTNSSATKASFQPGGSFVNNANTTLYAVWQKGCESNSHNYSYSVTKVPTTSAAGTLVGDCSICSNIITVTLPKLNTADYNYQIIKAATCSATGTGRYTWKTTTYGSFYFDVSIAATGHSYNYKATKVPTTSAAGTLTGTCSKCSGTTTVTLPKLNTTDYSYQIIKDATCTTGGTGRYTWKTTTYGSFYFDVSIAAVGHSYTSVTTSPTCTQKGYTTYTCRCGESYTADYVDALGHAWGDWIVIQEPTTTENGVEEHTCTRCGHAEQRSIAKLENPFNDVAPGSFFYEPVMWAIENGITNGTSATTFGPNDQCMRAHVVTFLWRAVGSPEPKLMVNPFVDVKPTDFYYKPVLWALENGITSGMDATHFGPTSYCNRAQVVTFLYRTMGSPDVGAATNPFTDVAAGSFYEKPVLWAVENGVTAGLSATSFGPNSICNRAQIVTFLYRAFVD